jgi:hypothetical protein
MADRWRVYWAGVLHGAGCLWVVGWILSHWNAAPAGLFGPTGWLPIPLALTLFLLGGRLLIVGRTPSTNGASGHGSPTPP